MLPLPSTSGVPLLLPRCRRLCRLYVVCVDVRVSCVRDGHFEPDHAGATARRSPEGFSPFLFPPLVSGWNGQHRDVLDVGTPFEGPHPSCKIL